MIRSLPFLLIFAAFAVHAQSPFSERDARRALRLTFAENVTASAVADADKLDDWGRAVALAEIGEAWYLTDRERGEGLFRKAVDVVFFATEDKARSAARLDAVRRLTKIVGRRSEKQKARLLRILGDKEGLDPADSKDNAEAIVDLALAVAKERPAEALQLGILALSTGTSGNVYRIVWALRKDTPALADELSEAILHKARLESSFESIAALIYAVIPESTVPDFPANLRASAKLRRETLGFLAGYAISIQAAAASTPGRSCALDAFPLTFLIKLFESEVPQRAPAAKQAINACTASLKITPAEATGILQSQDIDELIDYAEEHKDNPLIRMACLSAAAVRANNLQKHARTIEIYKMLTDKERDADNKWFWDNIYSSAAGWLAAELYLAGDPQASTRVLDEVPGDLAPFSRTTFALTLSETKDVADAPVTEALGLARKGFPKSAKPFSDKVDDWLLIIRTYAKRNDASNALESLGEFRKEFNRVLSDDPKAKVPQVPTDFLGSFPPAMIDSHGAGMLEAFMGFNDAATRVNLELALLRFGVAGLNR